MEPDRSRLITNLERLVGFNTENPPGQEVEAAQFILHELQAMGCRAEAVDIMPGRTNVVAVFENGPGPVFAFNTHIDVVPAGEGWTTDPFKLREDRGLLYARGSCDAKGPMVGMLEAMRILVATTDSWSGTLLGVFVADEEVASKGAKAYAKTGQAIDYCVIGEPTSCTTVTAHKGSLSPVIRVHGKAAHSGMPDLGVNAILKSAPFLNLVIEEHERVKMHTHNLCGQASLAVTRALGGHADNVVPYFCEYLLDRRMVPGEDEEDVRQELYDLVARASEACGVEAEITEFRETTGGATETPTDHPVVAAAQQAVHLHSGVETPITGFAGGCDLVHFRSLGAAGVVLGPGSLNVAHQPDEFVPIDELMRASQIYLDVAKRLLTGRGPEQD